ncbi:MAG: hypothetical protein K8U03_21030 [Planctomycetia bacterium]|nr:hypothetical protein [Planctomycetia bacterium]
MLVRVAGLLAATILTTIFTVAPRVGAAEEERVVLFEMVSCAPVPKGYEAQRRDFENAGPSGSTLILLTTPANKSRVSITVEKQKLIGKDQKVAAFKTYVNGIHGLFTKKGYRTVEIEHPDSRTLDPDQKLDLRLKLQKDGAFLYVDARIFFTDQGYTVWSVAQNEEERKLLMAWAATVRPK